MKKQHLHLSEGDRTYLEELVRQGELPVKIYRRAIGLLELDRGKTYTAVAETLGVNLTTISKLAQKYQTAGLGCLQDQARSGRPVEIEGVQRARVTALACSDAPEGYEHWSLRLLADKAVELGYCEHISHTEVSLILKKTNSSPI
jgi:putative transposase